ncbi:MAG: hypothetical protein BV456_07415 [Thermoplasmata archaeon M8B2D]|nr:MAG: hypothetical protein BV456_07415 [Thermoplasmata archaeon M8B2D]
MKSDTKITILSFLISIPVLILISLLIFKEINLYFIAALTGLDVFLCLNWFVKVRFFGYKK